MGLPGPPSITTSASFGAVPNRTSTTRLSPRSMLTSPGVTSMPLKTTLSREGALGPGGTRNGKSKATKTAKAARWTTCDPADRHQGTARRQRLRTLCSTASRSTRCWRKVKRPASSASCCTTVSNNPRRSGYLRSIARATARTSGLDRAWRTMTTTDPTAPSTTRTGSVRAEPTAANFWSHRAAPATSAATSHHAASASHKRTLAWRRTTGRIRALSKLSVMRGFLPWALCAGRSNRPAPIRRPAPRAPR